MMKEASPRVSTQGIMVKKYLLLLILSPPGNYALLPSVGRSIHSSRPPYPCAAAIKLKKLYSSPPRSNNNVHLVNEQETLFPEKLNIIYDSKCSVCQWEVDYLKQRMKDLSSNSSNSSSNNLIRFTDLEADKGYDESDPANGGVTYTMGMTSFHAVKSNGEILHGVPVFVEAYDIVDQGWLWEVTKWPVVGTLASWGYDMFAKVRTQLTRGSSVERLIEEHYTRRSEMMMKNNNDGGEEICEPCHKKTASETA